MGGETGRGRGIRRLVDALTEFQGGLIDRVQHGSHHRTRQGEDTAISPRKRQPILWAMLSP